MKRIVFDTSVWINLLATEEVSSIISAGRYSCLLPSQVLAEVVRNPVDGTYYSRDRHPLLRIPAVIESQLDEQEASVFLDLVSGGSVSRLGDGEAAAIAIAASRGTILAVDERKARKRVQEKFPAVQLTSSHEILRDPRIREALGPDIADDCIAKAFQFGRMHVVTR
jgi:predicted nucleic acid-binding protein